MMWFDQENYAGKVKCTVWDQQLLFGMIRPLAEFTKTGVNELQH